MADLGAIGFGVALGSDLTAQGPGAADALLVVDYSASLAFDEAPENPRVVVVAHDGHSGPVGDNIKFYVQGITKEDDVPVGRLVRVYDRVSGRLLNEEYSNPTSGRFYIVVENHSTEVFVMAFDDTGVGDDFNAQVYDLVIPKR